MTIKVNSLRKRNQSLSEKLAMFRTEENKLMKETVEMDEQRRSQRTLKMKQYYKEEKSSFE